MARRYLIFFSCAVIFLLIFVFFVYPRIKVLSRIKGTSTEKPPVTEISGIIVPHHEIAGELLIKGLERLSKTEKYSYVVIIGPNHKDATIRSFISATFFSGYPLASDKIVSLQGYLTDFFINEQTLENEHSISVPVKYVTHYFRDSKLLPIITPSVYSDEKLNEMADVLIRILPQDTLYVAGVDFSHDNFVTEADVFDSESIKAIETFNYDKIYGFSNDNLDSPSSIALFLKIMERLNKKKWELYFGGQSSLIEDAPSFPGTSYVVGVFGK